MPVAVTVAPDPVHMSVAAMVKPPVYSYKNITVMPAELMKRFAVFNSDHMRWRIFKMRGSFSAVQAHDAGQNGNGHYSSQYFLHNINLLYFCW